MKTQKEPVAYLQGFTDGSNDAHKMYDDIDESVDQIKSWDKPHSFKINWTVIILSAVCLGVICAMILSNQEYKF